MIAILHQGHDPTRTQAAGIVRIVAVKNRPLAVSVQSDKSSLPIGEPQRLLVILDYGEAVSDGPGENV